MRKPNAAQSALKLLTTRLHTHGIIGKCIVCDAELAGNKTKRQLRDRLARAQQAARVTESAELQRETELVGSPRTALYGGEIGGTQGPVPDQFSFGGRQSKQHLELLAGNARRLGMANCPK